MATRPSNTARFDWLKMREWIDHALPESVLRVLICLRLLIRDPHHQKLLHQLRGINLLARYMESVTAMYISCGEQAFAVQKLVTMTYMFQKLSAVENQRGWVIESGAHRTLVKLLSTTDSSVLLGALLALTTLAESPEYKEEIGELPIVENLLVILQEYDLLSKRMSAELLRLLSPVRQVRDQVRELEGLPVLLSLLHGQHLKLLWSIAWVLVQLCEDPDTRTEIRSWGVVQPLLRLLSSDRQYVSDRSSIETLSSANAAGRIQTEHIREELSPQEEVDNTTALQSACCTALTELSLDDTSAHHIVQEEELDGLRESIEAVDQNRPALRVINGYSILDHLGTGAFGSVFKMCLALRYLHKEKRIVHRDLTPNNIMLGEKDKVTITDFGLAKQKQENSKLTSVVGTILYSCPEIVKNEPYGEKADIWALGCILYQMATLQPPFYSSNMLSLANKIVEAVYEPIEEGAFSERVVDMIRWCLSPDADRRPDIVAVSSRISDLMMRLMDGLYTSQNALERRAERDRKRAQKYFLERHKSRTNSFFSQEKSLMKTESPAPRCSAACSSNSSSKQNISQDDASDEELSINKNTAASTGQHYVSAGICVSQKKLRQIDDPIQRLLVQLHKIIYITQLPPAPHHNIKRRVIERFKKSLFHYGSDPHNLKVELSKLFQASPELMELGSTSSDWWSVVHHFTGDPHAADNSGDGNLKDGVTYEQMQVSFSEKVGIIEELLEENSYYEATHSRVL
eukprot:superscaffoldBa00001854_g12270